MKTNPFAISLTAAVVFATVATADFAAAAEERATKPTTSAQAGMGDKTAAASDGEALATLMAVNAHEIAASKLALDRDVSAPVQEYAQMMVKEHTTNQEKTRAVAKQSDVSPEETAAVKRMKEETAAERKALEAKKEDAAFETAFMQAMVKDHEKALATIDDRLLPAAKDDAVQAHLRETRTHIEHHLQQARALAGKADSAAQR